MLHVQEPVSGWLESVQRLPAGALVKAFAVQWLSEARAANPAVRTLHRYVNDQLQDINPDDTEATREARARDWFNRFVDGTFLNGSTAGIEHWRATDMVSWWNEFYADSQDPAEKELWWKQERTAARIWQNEYRRGPHAAKLGHIKLAIAATAVGNNVPWQTAETATLYDCVVDYHAYSYWEMSNVAPPALPMAAEGENPAGRTASMNRAADVARQRIMAQPAVAAAEGGEAVPVRDPGDWQWLSGRWVTMDEEFRARGYTVTWLFGESGPFSSAVTGWRHEGVMAAHIPYYVEGMRQWIRDIKGTLAYQQGRVWGFGLFDTVGGNHWPYFQTRQPELNQLADMLRQEWTQVTPPPVDPPPPDPQPSPLPPTVVAQLWQASKAQSKLNLADALYLWKLANEQGYSVLYTETKTTAGGGEYTIQEAKSRTPGVPNRLYVFKPHDPIRWYDDPGNLPPPLPPVEQPKGTDVSRWQGAINWQKMKAAGAWYVFCKASEHTTWVDPRFAENWHGAIVADMLVGAYHFFRPGYDPIQQANHFVNTVRAQPGAAHLPYVLDVEIAPTKALQLLEQEDGYMGQSLVGESKRSYGRINSAAVAGFAADVQACLERIGVLTGRLPLLYTGIAFWDTYLRSIPTNICQLWIANWTANPNPFMPKDWTAWHFWQYTSDGNGPQYGAQSQRIDLNRWNGTLVQLYEYAEGV